jgi:amidase
MTSKRRRDRSGPIWQWSAGEIAAAISEHAVSAAEVMSAVVERARAENPAINAIVDDRYDAALTDSRALDEAIQKGATPGPLAGVPVTIKVNVDQIGFATTNGVAAFKDIIAPGDAPVTANLKRAGAIPIGRTNTPEFSFRATTDNDLYGRTMNPWNDWASAGGSSGGAAAAAMMGFGPIHHGNDIGGSLRFPSYACGAASVKPSLGRVPAYNPSQATERGLMAQLMSVQGVIAREVRDVRLGLEALIAPDPRDPWHLPLPLTGNALPKVENEKRVAFTDDALGFDLDPVVAHALTTAAEALTDAGYTVERVTPPMVREIADIGFRCLYGEMKLLMDRDIRRLGSETVNKIFDTYYEEFPPLEGEELLRAMAKRTFYARAWSEFQRAYPLCLTPFLFKPTYANDADIPCNAPFTDVLGAAHYSFAFNYLGLPAGIIPADLNDGLPVGVQLVAHRWREDLALDAIEAIEERVGVMADALWQRRGESHG